MVLRWGFSSIQYTDRHSKVITTKQLLLARMFPRLTQEYCKSPHGLSGVRACWDELIQPKLLQGVPRSPNAASLHLKARRRNQHSPMLEARFCTTSSLRMSQLCLRFTIASVQIDLLYIYIYYIYIYVDMITKYEFTGPFLCCQEYNYYNIYISNHPGSPLDLFEMGRLQDIFASKLRWAS